MEIVLSRAWDSYLCYSVWKVLQLVDVMFTAFLYCLNRLQYSSLCYRLAETDICTVCVKVVRESGCDWSVLGIVILISIIFMKAFGFHDVTSLAHVLRKKVCIHFVLCRMKWFLSKHILNCECMQKSIYCVRVCCCFCVCVCFFSDETVLFLAWF
jgi:hypothetical protein